MADIADNKELQALDKISKQIDNFSKELGEKVSKEEIDDLRDAIESIREIVTAVQADAKADEEQEEQMEEEMKKVNEGIAKLAKQLNEIREDSKAIGGHRKATREIVSKKEIKEFIDKINPGGVFDRNIKAQLKINLPITKAAEVITSPEVYEGLANTDPTVFTGRYVDPNLYAKKRKTNIITDHFPIGTVDAPTIFFMTKEEISGDDGSSETTGSADWIVANGQKPLRSFRLGTGTAEAKKVAIFATVADKVLRDVASFQNWLETDLREQMLEAYNDGLLNNNPSVTPDAPLGLKQNAVQYGGGTSFSGAVTAPNIIDEILAAASYMRMDTASKIGYEPSKVFISKTQKDSIVGLKDSHGRYQNNALIYVNAMGQLYISGVEVIGVSELDIPTTHFLMVSDEMGFNIMNYQGLVIESGHNGEDFRNDQTSFRAWQEVVSYISEHRYNTVMYDSFANVLADIEAGS